MNLAVAVNDASIEAVKATQASVTHERKDRRGTAAFAVAEAAGFGAAGFAGAAGGAGGGAEVVVGAGSRESSLLIGISQEIQIRSRGHRPRQQIKTSLMLPVKHHEQPDQGHSD
jgi:hypothetical protein